MSKFSNKAFFERPALFKALPQAHSCDAKLARPLGYGLGLTGERNDYIRGPVIPLLQTGRPSTVAWFVIAIVVSAVKRMPRSRALSHVGEEVIEEHPAFADDNASPSISAVALGLGVSASGLHRSPDVVLSRQRLPVSGLAAGALKVFATHFLSREFAMKAAARLNRAIFDGTEYSRLGVAALTAVLHDAFAGRRSAGHGLNGDPGGGKADDLSICLVTHSC